MALIILQATANETPDSGQGGLAVTTPSNTGHASTVTSVGVGATQTKTCRWFSFQNVGGQKTAMTLKIDHTSQGTLTGAQAANGFNLDYSLNAGGSWTTAVQRVNFTALQGPTTFSVGLGVGQDISQVQVRVGYTADTTSGGTAASVTATIANIQLEVTVVDANLLVMM